MRITANLASRPFTDHGPLQRRLRIAMGILAVVGLGFGVGLYALHNKAAAVRAHEHALDSNIATVRGEEQDYESLVRQPGNAQVLEHAATLNRLFDEKAFSWTLAMEDLETVLPGGVQVSTLEPTRNPKDGRITLRMRVVGPRDKAVELVQNLERSRRFRTPRITSETSETAGSSNQPLEPVGPTNRVNFDLLADYNPSAPAERRAVKKDASLEQVSARPARRNTQVPQSMRLPKPLSTAPKVAPPPQGGPR